MFGLYRRAFGGEIVRSFYDFDTRTIGPYKIPVDLYYDVNLSQGNFILDYIMYKVLLDSRDILAVFNLNNYCIVCVTEHSVYQLDKNGHYDPNLYNFPLENPIKCPKLKHIGYWKTFQENFSVSTLPYYMFIDEDGYIDGTDVKPLNPAINPPLNIYKYLVCKDEDILGMYYDMDKQSLVYVRRLENNSVPKYVLE